jgi:hypothetical protein
MDFAFRTAPYFNDSRRGTQLGFLKLRHALILAALAIAVGVGCGPSDRGDATKGQSKATDGPREVDFGFVELNPEQPTPITSYKNGGNMVVYAGEELRFQVVGDAPLPPIELRTGDSAQLLPGTEGKVQIAGPAGKPLPAVVVDKGSRLSLPGGAPPKISVKVQVYGGARPK